MNDFEDNWEQIHSSREWGKYPPEHLIRFISRLYKGKSDIERSQVKILDVGCGQGANTWYLAREGFNVYAFDGSKSAVKNALLYIHKDNLFAQIDVKRGLDMDYPPDFFDCVIDNASICCMGTRGMIHSIYENVYYSLKKSGMFFTVSFTENTYGAGTGKKIEPGTYQDEQCGMAKGVGHIHYTNKEEKITDLTSIGFQEIHIDEMRYTDRGNLNELLIATCRK